MHSDLLTSLEDLAKLSEALCEELDRPHKELVQQALKLEKWPIARLISIFERTSPVDFVLRHRIIRYLESINVDQAASRPTPEKSFTLGITGTPGAGKSTLTGEVCKQLLATHPELNIAVLAIDPSSQESGGALLGDRTRVSSPLYDQRLFFRSQASDLDLGGMGRKTFQVHRLLTQLFDLVIIETVGIGQSEIEVQHLADHTMLVMQPLAGDQVQFMKAGIMEVPDVFVVNKCDEESLAKRSRNLLKTSLKIAKISKGNAHNETPIFMCSATQSKGIAELSTYISELLDSITNSEKQNIKQHFIDKWLMENFGQLGLNAIAQTTINTQNLSYEEAELLSREQIYLCLQKLF